MPGDSFSILVMRFVCGLILTAIVGRILFRIDHETTRLFNLKKLYGLTKYDDEVEIRKTKKGVVFIYTLLSIIALAATLYMGYQVWSRL